MFKNTLLLGFMLASIASASEVGTKEQNRIATSSVISSLPFFKNQNIKVLGEQNLSNIGITQYSILATAPNGPERVDLFLSNDKQTMIIGQAFNPQTGQPISIQIPMQKFEQAETLTIGNGNTDIYVFTDPECPYCIRMEKELLDKLPPQFKAHVFLYPLPFHKSAEPASLYMLSMPKNKRINILREISTHGIEYLSDKLRDYVVTNEKAEIQNISQQLSKLYAKQDRTHDDEQRIIQLLEDIKRLRADISKKINPVLAKQLQSQIEIATQLGVRGTPSVFDSKGSQINWTELLHAQQ